MKEGLRQQLINGKSSTLPSSQWLLKLELIKCMEKQQNFSLYFPEVTTVCPLEVQLTHQLYPQLKVVKKIPFCFLLFF